MAAAMPEDRPYAPAPPRAAFDPPPRAAHRVHALHPLQAMLLAAALPLWLGAALADWAYASTREMQWSNFASWLIVGAMVFSVLAWLWSVVDVLRWREHRGGPGLWTMLLLLAVCVLGFVDALVHAKDAWAVMPEGLVLSVLVTLLALAANVVGFFSHRFGVRP